MVDVGRANNVIRISTSLQGRFFRTWIEYLTPLHNLTNREKDVIAAFIKKRFELSESISDPDILDREVMSDYTKSQIKEECNVSDAFFQVIIGKLRKTGIITNGKINPKFIPKRLKTGDNAFLLLLDFELDATDNRQAGT